MISITSSEPALQFFQNSTSIMRCQEYFLNHIDFMKPISYNLVNPFQIYKYGGYHVG